MDPTEKRTTSTEMER